MKSFWIGAAVLVTLASSLQAASLHLQVSDPEGKAIAGVQLTTVGKGASVSTPTEKTGKTTVALPTGTEPSSWVTLQVVGQEKKWVFLSPWNARTQVPQPGKGDDSTVPIVLGRPGDKKLLADPQALRTMAEQILQASAPQTLSKEASSAEGRRAQALQEVAEGFGLAAEEIDRAVRAWLATARDPYEQGLAELYTRDYAAASAHLAESLAIRRKRTEQARAEVADAAQFLGQALVGEGKYQEAVRALREAATLRPEDVVLQSWLTGALYGAGRYREAAQEARHALELTDASQGAGSPASLTGANNLAVILRSLGDLPGARRLHEEVLAGRTKLLGAEHPATLSSKHDLAEVLRVQGDLSGARKLQGEVLAERIRFLGPPHPDTLNSKNNLAVTLNALGDGAGARKLQEEVVASRTSVRGPEHPETLTDKSNLAAILRDQGDLAGALELQKEVLASRTRVLGPEHPDTLTSKSNLATILHGQGELAGALELQVEVLASLLKVLGPDHPDTLTCENNLATTLRDLGEFQRALRLDEAVLVGRTRLFGPEHPATLESKNNLAQTLTALGDLSRARDLQVEVLTTIERLLGPRHPNTTSSAWNLLQTSILLEDLAQLREATGKLRWLLEAEESSLSGDQRMIRDSLLELFQAASLSRDPAGSEGQTPP